MPDTIGFITYSEGCNDDVNKFVWSALPQDSRQSVIDVLCDFSHYLIGTQQTDAPQNIRFILRTRSDRFASLVSA